jgi:predicted RNA-binding Zn ribbon-like protein
MDFATKETEPEESERPPFELIAGNLCLDFINTLDDRPSGEPKELLKDYSDLARFGEQSGLLSREQRNRFDELVRLMPDESEKAMRRARELREALHDIFGALTNTNKKLAPKAAMDTLNANLRDAALHSQLVQPEVERETVQREDRCEWRFDDLTSSFDSILWPIARAAADLLVSSNLALVRACSSPTCEWFFLDTSKNHHRRWCSMKQCGNRAKVRRFYAKKFHAKNY